MQGFRPIAVIEVAALGDVWRRALRPRRDNPLQISMIALAIEAVALVVGRGDCPLGPLQRQLGDPKPLFERRNLVTVSPASGNDARYRHRGADSNAGYMGSRNADVDLVDRSDRMAVAGQVVMAADTASPPAPPS